MAGAPAAAPVTFVDIYDDAATLNSGNPTLSFSHSILAPSEAPPSYNPATDTLVSASLGLLFADATQGNDFIVVTWSNFNDSLTFTNPELGGGSGGFGNSLDFVINVNYRHALKVLALGATTGALVWERTAYDGPVHDNRHRSNTYASASVATDGAMVYASFESEGVCAFAPSSSMCWHVLAAAAACASSRSSRRRRSSVEFSGISVSRRACRSPARPCATALHRGGRGAVRRVRIGPLSDGSWPSMCRRSVRSGVRASSTA